MTAELRNEGYTINHKTVLKIMKSQGNLCKVRIKKYRSYKGTAGTVSPNLLERNFETRKPNEKWVTDVTEFRVFGERLYLSVLLDLHCQDVVSYTLSERPTLPLAIDMMNKAFRIYPQVGKELMIHSDQGWHYRHPHYRDMLAEREIQQSMSRKGNCLDNAVVEGFFAILKSELLQTQEFQSKEQFIEELEKYLDYYNNRRIKTKLKNLPPAVYRQQVTR